MHQKIREKFNLLGKLKFPVGRRSGSYDGRLVFLSKQEAGVLGAIAEEIFIQPEKRKIDLVALLDKSLADKDNNSFGRHLWRGKFYKLGLAYICALSNINGPRFFRHCDGSSVRRSVKKIMDKNENSFAGNFLKRVLSDITILYYSYSRDDKKEETVLPDMVIVNILSGIRRKYMRN